MKFTLHTTASPAVIHQTLGHSTPMSTLDSVTIVRGLTPGRVSDCFYGWGKLRDIEECKPHNLVQSREIDGLMLLGRRLMEMGNEVVITEDKDWSLVVPTAPIFYLAMHTH